jgi:uncharacterized iron-regulated membrane protein
MKNKKPLRKIILKLHEILGLLTGTVIFIEAVTGCLWVFKEEIESMYDGYRYVEAQNMSFISPTNAKKIAQSVIPDHEIHGTIYGKPNEAVEVIFYEEEPEFYQSVFLDPYNGEVLHRKNHNAGFFGFVLDGHIRLWMADNIGAQVVGISVLLFLVILISGLFLWWPKNRKSSKQRFRFVWNSSTRWKRKNFDLHSIVGFYIMSLAFILAFTGSVMAYDWFYYFVYKAAGGEKDPRFLVPEGSRFDETLLTNADKPIDFLIEKLRMEYPDAESFEVHYPHSDSSGIYVELSRSRGIYYDSDYLFFDQNTLEEIPTTSIYGKYQDASFADKVIRMNYDIHIGAIGGITGKIIAFLASLTIATLPVTGFLLWWGRRKKSKSSAASNNLNVNKRTKQSAKQRTAILTE